MVVFSCIHTLQNGLHYLRYDSMHHWLVSFSYACTCVCHLSSSPTLICCVFWTDWKACFMYWWLENMYKSVGFSQMMRVWDNIQIDMPDIYTDLVRKSNTPIFFSALKRFIRPYSFTSTCSISLPPFHRHFFSHIAILCNGFCWIMRWFYLIKRLHDLYSWHSVQVINDVTKMFYYLTTRIVSWVGRTRTESNLMFVNLNGDQKSDDVQ